MKRVARYISGVGLLCISLSLTSLAQVAVGTPDFGSFGGGPFDVVNLANLNVHFAIPVRHKAGRGMPFIYDLTYDNSVWYPAIVGGSKVWQPYTAGGYWGWHGLSATSTSNLTYSTATNSGTCGQFGTNHWNSTTYSNFVYYDDNGAHSFGAYYTVWISTDGPPGTCPPNGLQTGTTSPIPALDGSGINLTAYATSTSSIYTNFTTRTGTSFGAGAGGVFNSIDANGNELGTSGGGVFTDTLGQTALTVAGNPPSNTTLTYAAPSGANPSYTVSYATYTVKTSFGCSGIGEYNVANISLVNRITLPDSSYYQFSYEQTPGGTTGQTTGRIASVLLPTGGTITYQYTGANNGINCADGSASGLIRTTSPGGQWTYTRNTAGTQTTISDPTTPTNNQTVINFAEDTNYPPDFFETERQVYQGSATGTPLSTTITCYNTASPTPASCPTATVTAPISRRTVFSYLPNSSGAQSEVDTQYFSNIAAYPSEVDTYDFGIGSVGSLLNKVVTTYGVYGNVVAPTSTITSDGSGNVLSKTTTVYDGSSVTATSGTPQHMSITGGRGNPTTVNTYTSASTYLTKTFSYYDTGTLNTSTDVNGAVTTYVYGTTAQGTSTVSCGNSFPTQVNMPLSLSTSATWDCVGGVQKTSVDVNSNTTTTTYTDANFWRPYTVTYPDGGQTSFNYVSPTETDTSYKLDSSHSLQTATILDGFGRTLHQERTNDPLGIVQVDTTYDAVGNVSKVSNPHISGTTSQTDGTTQYTYDALGRKTQITNQDGSYQTISYVNRAIQIQDEGNGNGSHRVTKIYQQDGLGRLTSVCEVTTSSQMSVAPSACGQDIAATGFLTNYTYDALGNLLTVTQSGLNNRTYTYDFLSRLTSEINPETNNGGTTNTISYSYDSCSVGDLCSRTAPKPNQTSSATVTTSYSYDSLHRLTGKSYNDGTTNNVVYLYDQLAPWGWNISNPKGNLTEEYTATSSGALTEQMFDYDPMGRLIETGSCTPVNCAGNAYHFGYAYDLLGHLLTETNDRENQPNSVIYTKSYDAAGRLTQFQSNLVNSTHPGTLYTVNQYNPLGEIQQATYGNGVVENRTYNNRGALTSLSAGTVYGLDRMTYAPDGNILTASDSLPYPLNSSMFSESGITQYSPSQIADNRLNCCGFGTDPSVAGAWLQIDLGSGNAQTFTESRIYASTPNYAGNWSIQYSDDSSSWSTAASNFIPAQLGWNSISWSSVGAHRWWRLYLTNTPGPGAWLNELQMRGAGWTYSYDDFNRLATANQDGTSGYTYSYDRFGNRWVQNGSYNPSYTFDNNNHIMPGSGVVYDAAGNLTADGLGNNFTYDAEGRMLSATGGGSSFTYLYDANGQRVEETPYGSAPIDFINDQNGHFVTEATSNSWIRSELYAGGLHVATYVNGTTYFMHNDWLGSTKNQSDMSGNTAQPCNYLPFGDGFGCPGAQLSLMAFTGDEWDGPIGNLNHTLFREYDPTQGRWMVPDPAGMAAADPTNPQSWNRYAYVLNNPLAYVDPWGLSCEDLLDGTPCIVNVSACPPGQAYWRGLCVNISNVTGGNGCYVIQEYGGGIGGVQCPAQPPANSQNNNCPPGATCGSGGASGSSPTPSNGPHYTMTAVCAASTLLNKGGATALDLLGIIPGENTILKGAQFVGGLVSAGITIFGNSSPTDAVFTGVGSAITAVDVGKVMTTGTTGAKAVPIIGNVVSAAAAINDIYGKEGMGAYYDDCMAGKN